MEKEFSITNPEGLTLAEIREIAYQEGLNAGYTEVLARVMRILNEGRAVTEAELNATRKEILCT